MTATSELVPSHKRLWHNKGLQLCGRCERSRAVLRSVRSRPPDLLPSKGTPPGDWRGEQDQSRKALEVHRALPKISENALGPSICKHLQATDWNRSFSLLVGLLLHKSACKLSLEPIGSPIAKGNGQHAWRCCEKPTTSNVKLKWCQMATKPNRDNYFTHSQLCTPTQWA